MSAPITLEEFARRLKAMPRRVRDEVRRDARALARTGVQEAQRLAPVASGRLRRSIRSDLRMTSTGIDIALLAATTRKGAAVQEAQQPYLAPAIARMQRDLPGVLHRALDRALTTRGF